MRGGQDEVLHFLQACMDDIHRDTLSGDSIAGQLICISSGQLQSCAKMSEHDNI